MLTSEEVGNLLDAPLTQESQALLTQSLAHYAHYQHADWTPAMEARFFSKPGFNPHDFREYVRRVDYWSQDRMDNIICKQAPAAVILGAVPLDVIMSRGPLLMTNPVLGASDADRHAVGDAVSSYLGELVSKVGEGRSVTTCVDMLFGYANYLQYKPLASPKVASEWLKRLGVFSVGQRSSLLRSPIVRGDPALFAVATDVVAGILAPGSNEPASIQRATLSSLMSRYAGAAVSQETFDKLKTMALSISGGSREKFASEDMNALIWMAPNPGEFVSDMIATGQMFPDQISADLLSKLPIDLAEECVEAHLNASNFSGAMFQRLAQISEEHRTQNPGHSGHTQADKLLRHFVEAALQSPLRDVPQNAAGVMVRAMADYGDGANLLEFLPATLNRLEKDGSVEMGRTLVDAASIGISRSLAEQNNRNSTQGLPPQQMIDWSAPLDLYNAIKNLPNIKKAVSGIGGYRIVSLFGKSPKALHAAVANNDLPIILSVAEKQDVPDEVTEYMKQNMGAFLDYAHETIGLLPDSIAKLASTKEHIGLMMEKFPGSENTISANLSPEHKEAGAAFARALIARRVALKKWSDITEGLIADTLDNIKIGNSELVSSIAAEALNAKQEYSGRYVNPGRLADFLPPSMVFKERTSYRSGTEKARRLRDLVLAQGGEAHPNSLPKWNAQLQIGRVPNGNISAAKLQSWIDQQPESAFHTSVTTWNEGQQHNRKPSNVVQFNMTDDHLRRMREAGVLETFEKLHDENYIDSHPANTRTLGWCRYTATTNVGGKSNEVDFTAVPYRGTHAPPLEGIHIDEFQSDIGQSYARVTPASMENEIRESLKYSQGSFDLIDNAIDLGAKWVFHDDGHGVPYYNLDSPSGSRAFYTTARDAFHELYLLPKDKRAQVLDQTIKNKVAEQLAEREKIYPADHVKKINEILFGKKHPNVALHECFQQWARDNGWAGVPVAIADIHLKAALSGMDGDKVVKDKDGKHRISFPGHLMRTYRQQPQDMGWEENVYGTLPTQSNDNNKSTTIFHLPDPNTERVESEEAPSKTWQDEIRKSEHEWVPIDEQLGADEFDFGDLVVLG